MSDKAAAARDILAVPLFAELMDELEQAAVDAAVQAKITDDVTRAANMAEVRAIRSLRSRIEMLAREDEPKKARRAPA